jgi:hypothetical protein
MDPILLIIVGVLILFVILRIFFGFAKLFFKLGLIILLAILLWRAFFVKG